MWTATLWRVAAAVGWFGMFLVAIVLPILPISIYVVVTWLTTMLLTGGGHSVGLHDLWVDLALQAIFWVTLALLFVALALTRNAWNSVPDAPVQPPPVTPVVLQTEAFARLPEEGLAPPVAALPSKTLVRAAVAMIAGVMIVALLAAGVFSLGLVNQLLQGDDAPTLGFLVAGLAMWILVSLGLIWLLFVLIECLGESYLKTFWRPIFTSTTPPVATTAVAGSV